MEGLYELQAGGVAYMTGVIFFKVHNIIFFVVYAPWAIFIEMYFFN